MQYIFLGLITRVRGRQLSVYRTVLFLLPFESLITAGQGSPVERRCSRRGGGCGRHSSRGRGWQATRGARLKPQRRRRRPTSCEENEIQAIQVGDRGLITSTDARPSLLPSRSASLSLSQEISENPRSAGRRRQPQGCAQQLIADSDDTGTFIRGDVRDPLLNPACFERRDAMEALNCLPARAELMTACLPATDILFRRRDPPSKLTCVVKVQKSETRQGTRRSGVKTRTRGPRIQTEWPHDPAA